MSILVDCSPLQWRGRLWYHMTSDESIDELIIFSRNIGLKREWLQEEKKLPHFDITSFFRKRAIEKGARETSTKEVLAAAQKIGRQQ